VDGLAGQALRPLYYFLRAWKHAHIGSAYVCSRASILHLETSVHMHETQGAAKITGKLVTMRFVDTSDATIGKGGKS
jgi:hypothetical protein